MVTLNKTKYFFETLSFFSGCCLRSVTSSESKCLSWEMACLRDDTRSKVEAMSVELEEAKKKVAEFQKQCEEYLVVIVQQKREADEQQKVRVSVCLMLRLFIRAKRYDQTLILWYE